jgi:UDP-N-acetylmuramoylalanine--D-glutamate ligase
LTAIMPDHLDRYASMDDYVADKRIIYQNQDENDITVAGNDRWGKSFLSESRGRPLCYAPSPPGEGESGGWLCENGSGLARLCGWPGRGGETVELLPAAILVPGRHQKQNLLAAGLALYGLALDAEGIRRALGNFPGIEHRLEYFCEAGGVRFYNDSAATIPEAAAAAVEALSGEAPLVLVTGGSDKNLDFSPLVQAAAKTKAVVLLAGSGSEKLRSLLDTAGLRYSGPFDDLEQAADAAIAFARPGDFVALSPGCTSFGMFLNEFDRGHKWKAAVMRKTGGASVSAGSPPSAG